MPGRSWLIPAKTVAELIGTLSTKAILTEDQIEEMNTWSQGE